MKSLKLISAQAINTIRVSEAIAGYISDRLPISVTFERSLSWQERYRLLDAGKIHIGWICGLPYVRRADQPNPAIELLAAPVMQGARYQNRPLYFSDVVVRQDSPFKTFADLRGASWSYNEPGSQSGYNITRYYLAKMGETADFFGRLVEAGRHRTSLKMILNRQIDASAIDSTVLEWVLQKRPSLRAQIRIIDVFGPSPIPPFVISKAVPSALTNQIRQLLLQMHREEDGRDILAIGSLDRLTAVQDADYDPIREMANLAERVIF